MILLIAIAGVFYIVSNGQLTERKWLSNKNMSAIQYSNIQTPAVKKNSHSITNTAAVLRFGSQQYKEIIVSSVTPLR